MAYSCVCGCFSKLFDFDASGFGWCVGVVDLVLVAGLRFCGLEYV